MFEESGLLQRDILVLRATSRPDAQFTVLDEAGREIGHVTKEPKSRRSEALVLYDRRGIRVLSVEGHDGDRSIMVFDGGGEPAERHQVFAMKGYRHDQGGPVIPIIDSDKSEVGSFAGAKPPEGDHRLGVTFLFTITAEVSPEFRLAALVGAIGVTEKQSRQHRWIVKRLPKLGVAWPGSTPEASTR
jgi:hypothetical protein